MKSLPQHNNNNVHNGVYIIQNVSYRISLPPLPPTVDLSVSQAELQ